MARHVHGNPWYPPSCLYEDMNADSHSTPTKSSTHTSTTSSLSDFPSLLLGRVTPKSPSGSSAYSTASYSTPPYSASFMPQTYPPPPPLPPRPNANSSDPTFIPAPTSPTGPTRSPTYASTFFPNAATQSFSIPSPLPPKGREQPLPSFRSVLGSVIKSALLPGSKPTPSRPVETAMANYTTADYSPRHHSTTTSPMYNADRPGQISVNRVPLESNGLLLLQRTGMVVLPGRYWYDARSGAWGVDGGPCLGVITPQLPLGGPLLPDASGISSTGVFINGRQIHALDAIGLQLMGVTPLPGRWWVEADGRYGLEGTHFAIGNLRMQGLAGGAGSGGASSWSTRGGSFGGTDGQGFGYVGGPGWSYAYGG